MLEAQLIAEQLQLTQQQVQRTIDLFDAGNTLPFIARYRKEVTGGLDEEQLRALEKSLGRLRALAERRTSIIAALTEQGALTPGLQTQLDAATTLTELEDLYAPFKQKRRTRATIARERGLEPLAELIVEQGRQAVESAAAQFLSAEVPTPDAALAGARDIVAEMISSDPDVRRMTRERAARWAFLVVDKVPDAVDERGLYATYTAFEQRVDRLRPYQVLAINRGERDGVLKVRLDIPERDWRAAITTVYRPHVGSPWIEQLRLAISDAAERLLLPSIERDLRRTLTEQAEEHAIRVFASNVRALLSQPPLQVNAVLGLDPGFRTGCKVAVVDATGRVLHTTTIFPHDPQREWSTSLRVLGTLVQRHSVDVIAIGNGTASRETEKLAAELIRQLPTTRYLIVNEAGASVYSASPLARAELPDLDVSIRGAVSIARRVLDPLAELVKIDPQSIGVGLYQHDVNQRELTEALDDVVESVVNNVGVDVNTASPALLEHVAGIGPKLAERIVAHREEHGPFANRQALKKVKGLGPKSFEQAAGFLRVHGGDQPLDASAIHPESYKLAQALIKRAGINPKTGRDHRAVLIEKLRHATDLELLALELEAGLPTLEDVFEQLIRPGRDPRADLPAPILRSDVLALEDLREGMRLQGTVRNVVDFGAFVDIGVKNDGLLHRSQLPPGVDLNVGDVISVVIERLEPERGRIGLSLA